MTTGIDESLAIPSVKAASSSAAKPRVLLFFPGRPATKELQARVAALAEHLAEEGWKVSLHSGIPDAQRYQGNPDEPAGIAARLRFYKDLARALPRHDVLHIVADSRRTFWTVVAPVIILGKFFGTRIILGYEPAGLEDYLK